MSAAKQGSLRNVGGILSGSPRTQRTFHFDIGEDEIIQSNINFLDTWLDEIPNSSLTITTDKELCTEMFLHPLRI